MARTAFAWKRSQVKTRENRQKVMIRARMRVSSDWKDVCILNVSLHGLGIQSADPPPRGAYVEICRGRQTVVARVAWTKGHRAGLRSQDPIFVNALVSDTPARAPLSADQAARSFVERRQKPRAPARAFEDSQIRGRVLEFACVGLIGTALAFAAVGAASEVLARPMSAIRTALAPGAPLTPPARGSERP